MNVFFDPLVGVVRLLVLSVHVNRTFPRHGDEEIAALRFKSIKNPLSPQLIWFLGRWRAIATVQLMAHPALSVTFCGSNNLYKGSILQLSPNYRKILESFRLHQGSDCADLKATSTVGREENIATKKNTTTRPMTDCPHNVVKGPNLSHFTVSKISPNFPDLVSNIPIGVDITFYLAIGYQRLI